MPTRETILIPASDGPATNALRAVIVRPDQASSATVPLVVIHRGLAFTEADVDFLDHLAECLACSSIIALLFEPRATELILDDFHAFSLDQSIADCMSVIAYGRQVQGVDATRISIAAWSFGATTALEAATRSRSISRVCLINPASPAFIVSRAAKRTVQADALPAAVIDRLSEMVEERCKPAINLPTLIVHAAADRDVPAFVSESFVPEGSAMLPQMERVLIARADHAFTNPEQRAACIERIRTHFLATSSQPPVESAQPRPTHSEAAA